LAVALLPEVRAQDQWTRFRGPDGTGVSHARSIPVTFGEADYRWKVPLPGSGHSSPVLFGSKLFLTCEIREKNERFVACFDEADGRLLWSWKATFEPYSSHKFNSYAASTPAVDADRVYVSWISGATFIALALDHEGNELWQRRLENYQSRFGAGTSPIVLDDVVIVGNDHAGESCFLIGLDAKTGETRWKVPRKTGLTSFVVPAVYRPKDGPAEVVFASPAHGITGLDPQSGKVNWELGGLFTQKTVSSPVIAGEVVFATSGKGGRGVESAAVRRGDATSSRQAELAYQVNDALPYVPTPIVVGELMFIWADNGVVTCVEAQTGKQLWQERIGGEYFSSPICVNGHLYCVSKTGEVVVLEASPQYKLLARNQLPEGSYATPAVANGCLYLRTFNHLICVEGKGQ
jgi:outer membrane protein assembly factor BamB